MLTFPAWCRFIVRAYMNIYLCVLSNRHITIKLDIWQYNYREINVQISLNFIRFRGRISYGLKCNFGNNFLSFHIRKRTFLGRTSDLLSFHYILCIWYNTNYFTVWSCLNTMLLCFAMCYVKRDLRIKWDFTFYIVAHSHFNKNIVKSEKAMNWSALYLYKFTSVYDLLYFIFRGVSWI
jgi:hypothetical protein